MAITRRVLRDNIWKNEDVGGPEGLCSPKKSEEVGCLAEKFKVDVQVSSPIWIPESTFGEIPNTTTVRYAIVLPGRKPGFRDASRPDSNLSKKKPSGRSKAGRRADF